MRIVAGKWSGRHIAAPKGHLTRPTSDRAREAVFSALASRLGADLGAPKVLDLYAGSGALGLEALSRGAAGATFVERDRAALLALRDNVATLPVQREARIVAADVRDAIRRGLPGGPFALLFVDPPYRIEPAEVGRVLDTLTSSGVVEDGAYAVWEHATEAVPDWPAGFAVLVSRRYGGTSVDIAAYVGGAKTRS